MADPWTHHSTLVNGFRMHYVIAGSGYPLVFLHGWPQSWYEWRKIIPTLAARYTVIAPDTRGIERQGIGVHDLDAAGSFLVWTRNCSATQSTRSAASSGSQPGSRKR